MKRLERTRMSGVEPIWLALAVVATTGILLAAPPVSSEEPSLSSTEENSFAEAKESFRWEGEEFYYSVRLNGAEAIRAGVRVGDVRKVKNRPYVPISGTAQSVGFFRNVYPLEDQANTFMDPQSHRPLRSEKFFDERGKQRTYKVDYIHSTYRAKVEKKKKNRTYKYSYSIPGTTHDMLTWMYELRTSDLAVGKTFRFYVYDGWKLSRVDIEVVAKEDVYTPMGWFKGWKMEWVREVMRSKRRRGKKGKPLEPALRMRTPNKHAGGFWLSRDENRLPIKLTIDTKFGTGEALLIKYKPADDN